MEPHHSKEEQDAGCEGTVRDEEKEPGTDVLGSRWATCLQLSLQDGDEELLRCGVRSWLEGP